MSYEQLSDLDINKQVAWALGLNTLPEVDGDIDVFIVPCDEPEIFDPCNNPNDAWPIIVEHKIHTGWAYDDYWSAEISNQGQAGPFKRWNHTDKNPLRCAMIVFLMMNEDK